MRNTDAEHIFALGIFNVNVTDGFRVTADGNGVFAVIDELVVGQADLVHRLAERADRTGADALNDLRLVAVVFNRADKTHFCQFLVLLFFLKEFMA